MARLADPDRTTPGHRWLIRILLNATLIAFISFAVCLFSLHLDRYNRERADRAAKASIEVLLIDQAASWNAGDLDGFMAGYWDSPDLEFVSDKTTLGFQPVQERYFKSYKAEGKEMGVLTFTDLHVTVLTDSEANATGNWKVVKSQDTSSGGFTLTLRKFDNGWKIIKDVTTSDTSPKKK